MKTPYTPAVESGLEAFRLLFESEHPVPMLNGQRPIGVEVELWTASGGQIVPEVPRIFPSIKHLDGFGFELSAAQLEIKARSDLGIESLASVLGRKFGQTERLLAKYACAPLYLPCAPENLCLDIYPDSRYEGIENRLPAHKLSAARRVAGVHIHIGGFDSLESLIVAHDCLVDHQSELMDMGDLSKGARHGLCTVVMGDSFAKKFVSIEGMWAQYCAQFQDQLIDPRSWWKMIRITRYGTIEIRVFDTTDDVELIVSWARRVLGMLGE